MRYLSLADTQRLDIRMTEVVPVIERAFRLVGQGRAVATPRVRLVHPPLPRGSLGQGRPWNRNLRITPAALEGIGFGVRLGASIRLGEGHPTGGVLLLLFDWETMALKALISDHLVHAVRSTAANGVLAKYLALHDAGTLGLIGSGRLARWAAEAVCAVRPIRHIRLWSPNQTHRGECVQYLRSRLESGMQLAEAENAEEVVRGAQVVVAATNAREPVLRGEWLDAGCTVISNRPEELDRATIRRGRIVTTYRDGLLQHEPPFNCVLELLESNGVAPAEFLTELGDIVVGRCPGRRTDQEIIACLNPAYGVLDTATADYVYRKALRLGIGTDLQP